LFAPEVAKHTLFLLFEGGDVWGQETPEPEAISLFLSKRSALVERRTVEELDTPLVG
jgi:hypothetical protein